MPSARRFSNSLATRRRGLPDGPRLCYDVTLEAVKKPISGVVPLPGCADADRRVGRTGRRCAVQGVGLQKCAPLSRGAFMMCTCAVRCARCREGRVFFKCERAQAGIARARAAFSRESACDVGLPPRTKRHRPDTARDPGSIPALSRTSRPSRLLAQRAMFSAPLPEAFSSLIASSIAARTTAA